MIFAHMALLYDCGSMGVDPLNHEALPQELVEYISAELGPVSLEKFREPAMLEEYLQLRKDGVELADAVLRLAHGEAIHNSSIGDEFLSHFLTAMMRVGRFSMRAGLRRYLDSGDLVNSVAGSVWKDLATVKFSTRREYLAFLGRRLQWKAADKAKALAAGKRRLDLQLNIDFESAGVANLDQAGPATQAGNQEDVDRLLAILPRLPKRDQDILRSALRGESVQQIAEAMELSQEAARKALKRAIKKAQRLL